MDEARKHQIAYQLLKSQADKHFSAKMLRNARRQVGNIAASKEMVEINATKEELLEFGQIMSLEITKGIVGM